MIESNEPQQKLREQQRIIEVALIKLFLLPQESLKNQPSMIEVTVNDRLGKKVRVKCLGEDTVEDFKKVLSVQLGHTKIPTNYAAHDYNNASQHSSIQHKRLVLVKGQVTLKDHITLEDYEIHDGTNIELYYA